MSAVVAAQEKADLFEFSPWARTQYLDKYSKCDLNGKPIEEWPDTAQRVVETVLNVLGYGPHTPECTQLRRLVEERKFIPGGRYLANTGMPFHQVNNCFLYRCGDSREEWSNLLRKAVLSLSTGGGIGVVYSDVRPFGTPLKRVRGHATGPLSPMKMVNEVAREVMAGSRRSAIWAGLHWWHPDIFEFIKAKEWSDEIKALKEKDYSFPATLDMTNISVILDDDFFVAYNDPEHTQHKHAQRVYWETTSHMVRHGEPGFSVNCGADRDECLRNAPIAGDTHVLTGRGYQPVKDLLDSPVERLWTGENWAENVEFKLTQKDAPILSVEMTGGRVIRCEPSHEFLVERYRGVGERRVLDRIERVAAQDLKVGDQLHVSHHINAEDPFDDQHFNERAYTLGWIYGDGSFTQAGGADLTLCSEASKACLSHIVGYHSCCQEDPRGFTRLYFSVNDYWRARSKDRFPVDIFGSSNGYDHPFAARRAFVAGLFDADGNWEPKQKRIRLASKYEGFLRDVARVLEAMGIIAHVTKSGHSTYGQSQIYQLVVAADSMKAFVNRIPIQRLKPDLDGYKSYRASAIKVLSVVEDGFEDVYCADVKLPEHSFQAEGVIISNCTEITSADDSDVCNLGSINLARIEDPEEMALATRLGTLFLLAGTVYSDVPHVEVRATREKNRRLGLGLMGVHEWLISRGYNYEVNDELRKWLEIYENDSNRAAIFYANRHHLSVPKKKRAIAPNGTIGIIAMTTTSAEPVIFTACKRRFLENGVWKYQYVIDPTVERMHRDYGIDPDEIETAYSLAYNVEKRIKFQYDLQKYVDHSISSTINLPYPIVDADEVRDFGNTLLRYLPGLRGITVYPNGARAGQPFTSVPYSVAAGQLGVTFEENRENECSSGVCGI